MKDTLSGDDGNDVFGVDNDHAGKDVVTCGGNFDWVFAKELGRMLRKLPGSV